MKIIKLYRKPDQPEFYVYIKRVGDEILLNYPVDKPDRKRMARWLHIHTIHIDWVKEFRDECI